MDAIKTIALVAHDNCKKDMVEWVNWNWNILFDHKLVCTGTTGRLVEDALKMKVQKGHRLRYDIVKLKSGPFGGDQQLGSMIVEGKVDILIFFWDPMLPQPHDVDVKALLRISVLYNIPSACNRATADFLISSHLMNEKYSQVIKDQSEYLGRILEV
jgi:methylglyoxal synthase